jgi:SNF2 family DNA or RNA helicase
MPIPFQPDVSGRAVLDASHRLPVVATIPGGVSTVACGSPALEVKFVLQPSPPIGDAVRMTLATIVGMADSQPGRPESHSLSRRLRAALQPPIDVLLRRSGPLEWPADFMPFQIAGIRLLFIRGALLLADEMGLGKTIQSIAALRLLSVLGQIESSLVVVPASLLPQWRRQLDTWAPDLRVSPIRGTPDERIHQWKTPAHLHLVGYETLRSDIGEVANRHWDLVVIDEAQKIKNPDTDMSQIVKRLLRSRAWALTGTPLENRIEDLASILDFVRPNEADSRLGPVLHGPQLRTLLNDVQLRRRKIEVLNDLPPRIDSEIVLAMSPIQRAAYDRAEKEGLIRLYELGSDIRIQNVLELILRLKQLCNFDSVTGASAKLDDLINRLDELTAVGEKALVFSQFTDATFGVAAIAQRLKRFNPVVYTGSMSMPARDEAVSRFLEERSHHAMILSLKAGGQGLNLQKASYVFHFDRWWNPAVEDQAAGRVHRIGQERTVNVYGFTVEGTIEERIQEIMAAKRGLFTKIVEGAGIDLQSVLTKEDLLSLVGIRPPSEPLNTRPAT